MTASRKPIRCSVRRRRSTKEMPKMFVKASEESAWITRYGRDECITNGSRQARSKAANVNRANRLNKSGDHAPAADRGEGSSRNPSQQTNQKHRNVNITAPANQPQTLFEPAKIM